MISTIILDNGGHNMKIGTVNDSAPRLVPNSIIKSKHDRKRVFIGSEQEDCTDKFSLFYVRPIERGYVVNWDVQQQIWEHAFNNLSPETPLTRILLTDNNYLIPALPDVSSEILFEHFGFEEVCKSSSSALIAEKSCFIENKKCVCVVDSGFSWTTISCFVDGNLIQESVVRIDVGGKALTNKLKDWISYRQLNVSEETFVINQCKEDLCYVALDFEESLKTAQKKQSSMMRRYVMPDFQSTFRGIVKNIDEVHDASIPSIHLGVERFAIPELIFNPSDIDINQCGIAEAVIESLCGSPEELRAALSNNIVVVGGSSCFPGFIERLQKEVRSLLPAEFEVNISNDVQNLQTYAWHCAQELLTTDEVTIPWINRTEWNEKGDSLEFSKFFKTLPTSKNVKKTSNDENGTNRVE